ncbi:hypothetical protein OS187_08885 [Xanthomonadaceae bacterium JHOS43]|nr:hypothetical protein [Xanthomonadaceae bacterium JHOS43]
MRSLSILLICLLAPPLSAETGRHPCAKVPDPSTRLACYDNAFPPDPDTISGAADTARGDFGLEKPTEPEHVESRVLSVDYGRGGSRSFALENGQLWVQTDAKTNGHVKTGDTVTVRRGIVGNYVLTTSNGVFLRVRRVR